MHTVNYSEVLLKIRDNPIGNFNKSLSTNSKKVGNDITLHQAKFSSLNIELKSISFCNIT